MASVIVIHAERCTGCDNCIIACAVRHLGRFRRAASRVDVFSSERDAFSVPMMCQQCDAAPCSKVCPTAALLRAPGAIVVEYTRARCIGCRLCTIACPFGNITYDVVTDSIVKCDNCGGDPACVAVCPGHALEYVDESLARPRKKPAPGHPKPAPQEATQQPGLAR